MSLTKVNWEQFKIRNEHYTKAFEDLCYHLFCRKYKLAEGVRADVNHVGLETEPTLNGGELIGFQSKFFDNKLSDSSSGSQISKSIVKAKKTYPKLKRIIIYTHHSFGAKTPKYKTALESAASPVIIDWYVASNFNAALFQPANHDLLQLYFGQGAELAYLKSVLTPELNTFLVSESCMPLPWHHDTSVVTSIMKEVLAGKQKKYLLTGNPGSGKSISMYYLFYQLAGLTLPTDEKILEQLILQDAIPVLVNLRNCVTDSLENILRGRENDNNLRGSIVKIIYILDGLDEIHDDRLDAALTYIAELENKASTKKIVISCRLGSQNRLRARSYFSDMPELKLANLEYRHIALYFAAKKQVDKITILEELVRNGAPIITEIHDILLLSLFFDTIEQLNVKSTIIDLLDRKMDLLLISPKHYSALESLNLLNPKESSILSLQEDIAYKFHKRFQFRISLKELQNIILKKLQYNDYASVNKLVNYLSDLFFERTFGSGSTPTDFIYQHRRYQEYFAARKLRKYFDENPKVLRNANILSNPDFFDGLFLPYLENSYRKENNLIGFLKLNLIALYSGQDSGWGADDPYYLESPYFVYALVQQAPNIFEMLYYDSALDIKNKLYGHLPEPAEIEQQLQLLKGAKDKYGSESKLVGIYNTLPTLLTYVVALHKADKAERSKEVLDYFFDSIKVFEQYKFKEHGKKKHLSLKDIIFEHWEDYLYVELVINKKELLSTYNNLIVKNYKSFPEYDDYYHHGSKQKLVGAFLEISLNNLLFEFVCIYDQLDQYTIVLLMKIMSLHKNIHLYYGNEILRDRMHESLTKLSENAFQNLYVIFFKKLKYGEVSEAERSVVLEALDKFKNEDESRMERLNLLHEYAVAVFLESEINYNYLFENHRPEYNYYASKIIYACTYQDYLLSLGGTIEPGEAIRNYIEYTVKNTRYAHEKDFKKEISSLWASFFLNCDFKYGNKKTLIKILTETSNNIDLLNFYYILQLENPILKEQILDINSVEKSIKKQTDSKRDMMQQINHQFQSAILYARKDDVKAVQLITEAINNSTLRHGWRKDYIVSDNLVDALKILWEQGWMETKEIKEYTQRVYNLAVRVAEITDGKGTWHGPYNFISMIALQDIRLAKSYRKKFLSHNYRPQHKLHTGYIKGMLMSGCGYSKFIETIKNSYLARGNYKGENESEFHIERFKAFLFGAQNDLFTRPEQKSAFDLASMEVDIMLGYNDYFVNWKNELGQERIQYSKLCQRFGQANKIPEPVVEKWEIKEEAKNSLSEETVMAALVNVKTKKTLNKWLHYLSRESTVEIKDLHSWKKIVDKLFIIEGNIQSLLEVMKNDYYFPRLANFGGEKKHMDIALAAALDNINTRQQTLNYLFENSGHDGFLMVIKSFTCLRNEKMVRQLFKNFVQFCEFLVN